MRLNKRCLKKVDSIMENNLNNNMETGMVMDTEDFQWRTCARCVAYFDLVMAGVAMVVAIGASIIWAAGIPSILDYYPEQYSGSDVQQFVPLLFAVIFTAIGMEMWCATLLLKATIPGVDPTYALYKASVFRNVNILFLMFTVIINGVRAGYAMIACQVFLIVQGSLLFLVCKFIKELREAAGSPSISDA